MKSGLFIDYIWLLGKIGIKNYYNNNIDNSLNIILVLSLKL
jgi:hypothetical protein